jgi:hypothetical protein
VYVLDGGAVTAGSLGTVNVEGYGTVNSSSFSYGVMVSVANSRITSSGGNVSVIGTGGGTGSSSFGYGVNLYNGGQIMAGGSGTVYVEGKGSNSNGSFNYGIYAEGANARITSSGGNVTVKGTGGESDSFNYGVYLYNGGQITAGSNGTVNVEGQGGNSTNGTNYNYGIFADGTNSRITSSGGNVIVKGTGGGIQSYNYGVHLRAGGEITAGSNGTVNVEGQGGNATEEGNYNYNYNYGIYVTGNNARITSSGGSVTVKGTGGSGPNHFFNYGVNVYDGGVITAGGNGTVNVEGQGGNTTGGNYNFGVNLSMSNAQITSSGGNVIVKGTGGTGNIDNYGVNLETGGEITAGGNGSVNVEGQGGNATGESNYGINLKGSITSTNGGITVKGTGSNGAADIMMNGGIISSASTTAGISINSPTNGTWPNTTTTDVSTTPTQKLTFATGSKLNIQIAGLTVNSQYRQLNAVGMVDLNGANVTFAGSTHTPLLGNTFTIVNNDATDAIIGTFSGLPEGATIANFLGSGLSARITYVGGDGNDVVLSITCPVLTASSNSPVCIGTQLNLSVSGGTAWIWSGPNGFTNNTQYPVRPSVDASMAGVYSVTVSAVSGCTQIATTQVTTRQTLNPQLSSNSPLCVGTTLRLSVTGAGVGSTYNWGTSSIFSSTLQNPTRPNATVAMSGTYSVTVNGACGSTVLTTSVVVSPNVAPSITALRVNNVLPNAQNNTVAICNTAPVTLTVAATNAVTYSWRGPTGSGTGFESSLVSPVNFSVATPRQGQYTVTVRNGCTVFNHRVINIQLINCSNTRLASAEDTDAIEMELNAYPNPVSNSLTVEVRLKEAHPLQLKLLNSAGQTSGTWQLSEASTVHRTELNLSDLTGGIYLLEAQAGQQRAVKRVVKVE